MTVAALLLAAAASAAPGPAVTGRAAVAAAAEDRVAADLAGAWLLKTPKDRRTVAKMLRAAGITWVRERLRWAEVEPVPGKFVWGKYDETASILHEEGLKICQVWHDTPAWARPGNPQGPAPDDLRSVHRFAQAAAAHFKGRIQAWELWNEPDIFFWSDLSDRYAGYVAAAATGLRAGDPDAVVLLGSLCSGIGPFTRGVAAAGALDWCDAFNWHLYKPPRDYPGDLAEYRALFSTGRTGWRPAWMTEAGIRLAGTEGEGKRRLTAEDVTAQARYVPRSVAMSLAAGTARHFFFVVPDYLENGIQYGALHPDLTPLPAFTALGVAARWLGASTYLGRWPAGEAEVRAFRTPRGLVLVAWSDQPTTLDIPATGSALSVADQAGTERRLGAEGGSAPLGLGPDAVYVLGAAEAVAAQLTDLPPPSGAAAAGPLTSGLVLAARSVLPLDKERDARVLDGSATTFVHEVEVVRFGAASPRQGGLRLTLPAGWTADRTSAPLDLPEGGRVVLPFRLTPAAGSLAPAVVRAEALTADGARAAVVESRFLLAVAALEEASSVPLPWADPARWHAVPGSAAGAMTVTRDGQTGQRFTGLRTPGTAGWWEVELDADLAPALAVDDAVSCTAFLVAGGATDAHVYLMLAGEGGKVRMTGGPVAAAPHTERFLLRDMGYDAAAGRVTVRLGVWTGGALPAFTIDGFRQVRLRARKPPVQ